MNGHTVPKRVWLRGADNVTSLPVCLPCAHEQSYGWRSPQIKKSLLLKISISFFLFQVRLGHSTSALEAPLTTICLNIGIVTKRFQFYYTVRQRPVEGVLNFSANLLAQSRMFVEQACTMRRSRGALARKHGKTFSTGKYFSCIQTQV